MDWLNNVKNGQKLYSNARLKIIQAGWTGEVVKASRLKSQSRQVVWNTSKEDKVQCWLNNGKNCQKLQ